MKRAKRSVVRDARRGLTVTRQNMRETVRSPMGLVSADWRIWSFPVLLALFAFMPLIAAARGLTPWVEAVAIFVGCGALAVILLALLARYYGGGRSR